MSRSHIQASPGTRLLVLGGLVFDGSEARPADVLIDGDTIVGVKPELGKSESDAQRLDATGFFVMPGFANAHTHTHNVLGRGLFDVGSLEVLVNCQAAMWRGRTADETYAAAALNALEMLRSGTTSVCDQFQSLPGPSLDHVDAVVQAYMDVGLRASVSPSLRNLSADYSLRGVARHAPEAPRIQADPVAVANASLATLSSAVDRWHGKANGRITIGVAPSSPLVCTDDMLRQCSAFARDRDLVMHTHVAETRSQAREATRRFGKTLIRHLSDVGALSERSVLAQCVWISEDDIQQLADAAAIIAHNPLSNMRLGSGLAPIHTLLSRGARVALGTDGMVCSDTQNMFEALRAATLISRLRTTDQRKWLSAQTSFALATTWTSKLLGVDVALGSIAPGYKADMVLLNAQSTFLHPRNHLVTQIVLAEAGFNVDTVIVDGRIVLRGGRACNIDEGTVLQRVDEAAARLRAANHDLWQSCQTITPLIQEALAVADDRDGLTASTSDFMMMSPRPIVPSRDLVY